MVKQAVKTITALFTIVLVLSCTMVTSIFADDTATQSDYDIGHLTSPEYTFTESTNQTISEGLYYYEIDYTNNGTFVRYSSSYGNVIIRISTSEPNNSTITGYVYIPDFQDAFSGQIDFGSSFVTEFRLYRSTLSGVPGVSLTHDSTSSPTYTISTERSGIQPGYYYVDVPFGTTIQFSSRNNINAEFVVTAGVGSRPSGNYTGVYIYLPQVDDMSTIYKYYITRLQEEVDGQIQEVDQLTTPVNIYPAYPTSDNEYYNQGYEDGYQAGYEEGETAGYENGYEAGETAGYNTGYEAGETAGYESGYDEGYQAGLEQGTGSYNEGYQAGYADGIINGQNVDEIVGNGISGFFEGMKEFFEPFLLVGIGDLTIANMFYLGLFLAFIVFIVKLIRG